MADAFLEFDYDTWTFIKEAGFGVEGEYRIEIELSYEADEEELSNSYEIKVYIIASLNVETIDDATLESEALYD